MQWRSSSALGPPFPYFIHFFTIFFQVELVDGSLIEATKGFSLFHSGGGGGIFNNIPYHLQFIPVFYGL